MGMSSSPWNIVTFTPSVSACSQPAPRMGPHRHHAIVRKTAGPVSMGTAEIPHVHRDLFISLSLLLSLSLSLHLVARTLHIKKHPLPL